MFFFNLSLFLLAGTLVTAAAPVVNLDYANYEGVTDEKTGVTTFEGMRFAKPPIRFRGPLHPADERNKGVQKLTGPGKSCIGLANAKDLSPNEDEDCLFINVFAPNKATNGKPLPVLFQIQGGGLAGSNAAGVDGTSLITASGMQMLVVTFNYRVNFYGFLASKEIRFANKLSTNSKDHASFNVGYLDQRAAMMWVQKYIHLFGGDPKQVVLTGASAGAGSIVSHLMAYGGRDDKLFIGAAAESQSLGAVRTIDGAQYQYDALVDTAGCKDKRNNDPAKDGTLACLRSINPHDLQLKIHNVFANQGPSNPSGVFKVPYPEEKSHRVPVYMWGPVIDGNFVQDYPFASLDANKFVKVPVIFGDDTNEGSIFVGKDDKINNQKDLGDFIKASYPLLNEAQLSTIEALYPAENNDFTGAASKAYGEMRYICPGVFISSKFADAQPNTPVWNYRYDVGFATHVSEGGLIWGTSSDKTKTKQLQDYWTSFILHRNPNKRLASGATIWDEWNSNSMNRLLIDDTKNSMEDVEKGKNQQKDRCEVLNKLRCRKGQGGDCA
ncbi:MAG: hypothetical protein M1812_003553 [Candelaria pacifica]|nr:MAG: hypothetical protein M1812_003553 [Candelaria pacifica]